MLSKEIKMDKMITVNDYAKLHGKSPVRVRQLLQAGRLRAVEGNCILLYADQAWPEARKRGPKPHIMETVSDNQINEIGQNV
jgi:hypothetical protein